MSKLFEGVDTVSIMDATQAALKGSRARSLWKRIDSEFSVGGVAAASSYLKAQFGEIASRITSELSSVKTSSKDLGR